MTRTYEDPRRGGVAGVFSATCPRGDRNALQRFDLEGSASCSSVDGRRTQHNAPERSHKKSIPSAELRGMSKERGPTRSPRHRRQILASETTHEAGFTDTGHARRNSWRTPRFSSGRPQNIEAGKAMAPPLRRVAGPSTAVYLQLPGVHSQGLSPGHKALNERSITWTDSAWVPVSIAVFVGFPSVVDVLRSTPIGAVIQDLYLRRVRRTIAPRSGGRQPAREHSVGDGGRLGDARHDGLGIVPQPQRDPFRAAGAVCRKCTLVGDRALP